MAGQSIVLRNNQPVALTEIPRLSLDAFRAWTVSQVEAGKRLAVLCCFPQIHGFLLCAVLADDANGWLELAGAEAAQEFPSLTPQCVQAQLFEREIFETYGLRPVDHPWLKPVRFPCASHHPNHKIGEMDYFQVEGPEVHEVAVGPVHAGVIEPGHFRFQCHGERVFHLEISLGYQHRGVMQALLQASESQRRHLMETAAGDATAGHTTAYCNALDALAGRQAPARAHAIRGIALEFERIACHIGDLGAMAGDVGFLPTQAYCGRIRGAALNMTAAICGNRFSRGLIRPGGVAYDLDDAIIRHLLERLEAVRADAVSAIELLWITPSVLERFERTGVVSKEIAEEIGLVGPAARACGLNRDVRHDFARGIYQFQQIPIASVESGDVYGRAMVRWLELLRSMTFVREMLLALPDSKIMSEPGAMKPESIVVSLVEGWRGEICHIAVTDAQGELSGYKIIDPSFHNWFGLACALRDEAISDFPLCNKSFNLSYCGFDL
ncbi:NADH-quinone oxidoreductase subunit C [Candidatus Sumerlaeota bacterium]|nr:NADH-quinone oxidoreductase subunit C [Candidatus Sumerlaeota bacterium]